MNNHLPDGQDIINYYNTYDEDGRLFRDYSHQIEWLTTLHYFDKLFPRTVRFSTAVPEAAIMLSNWPGRDIASPPAILCRAFF